MWHRMDNREVEVLAARVEEITTFCGMPLTEAEQDYMFEYFRIRGLEDKPSTELLAMDWMAYYSAVIMEQGVM